MRKRAIAATMLLTAAMAFTSCAKLYEEETTETLKLPQTDIEIPEDNPLGRSAGQRYGGWTLKSGRNANGCNF